jgi:hypothetical protein
MRLNSLAIRKNWNSLKEKYGRKLNVKLLLPHNFQGFKS